MNFTCDFVPAICKPSTELVNDVTFEKQAKYSGSITLKPISYDDRLDFMEAQTVAMSGDESQRMVALLGLAKDFSRNHMGKYFVSSSIVRLEDNYVFDSLEKIKMDGPVSACLPEISMALISGGLSLGK